MFEASLWVVRMEGLRVPDLTLKASGCWGLEAWVLLAVLYSKRLRSCLLIVYSTDGDEDNGGGSSGGCGGGGGGGGCQFIPRPKTWTWHIWQLRHISAAPPLQPKSLNLSTASPKSKFKACASEKPDSGR